MVGPAAPDPVVVSPSGSDALAASVVGVLGWIFGGFRRRGVEGEADFRSEAAASMVVVVRFPCWAGRFDYSLLSRINFEAINVLEYTNG